MDELKIYKFHWDCGRMGDLEGLIAATETEVKSIEGTEVYFGEVLGKHSEVFGTFQTCDVTVLNVSSEAAAEIVAVTGRTISGYNPFDYIEEQE